MRISTSTVNDESDLRQMEALACRYKQDYLHSGDLPYRLCSWSLDDPANTCLWKDEEGRLLAWAVLQFPFGGFLDFVCTPRLLGQLLPQILEWEQARSHAHPELVPLGTPEGKPCWFTTAFSEQSECRRILESYGYADQGDVGENS